MDPNWPEAIDETVSDDDEGNDNDEDDDELDDVWTRMESRVPIGIVMVIIIGYIAAGGFMFNQFEGWTLIQSVYFCYISLSTVGFGDYVSRAFHSSRRRDLVYSRSRESHQVPKWLYASRQRPSTSFSVWPS